MSHADVTAAIRKVHSGGRGIPEPVSKALAERRPHSELSPREMEVLQLIAGGCNNKEIGTARSNSERALGFRL